MMSAPSPRSVFSSIVKLLGPIIIVPAIGGGASYFSFAPYNLWPLGVVGIALLFGGLGLLVAMRRRHFYWCAAGAGFVWALALYLPLFQWIQTFVEEPPWIALCIILALFVVAITVPVVHFMRLWGVFSVRTAAASALWWTAVEAVRARFPFGGFSWGTPAYGQSTSPLVSAAPWGSASAVTFLVVMWAYTLVIGAAAALFLAYAAVCRRDDRGHTRIFSWYSWPRPPKVFRSAVGVLLIVLTMTSGSFIYDFSQRTHAEPTSTRRIAFVQGDVSTSGLTFNAIRMEVLENHAQATFRLADAVRLGKQPQPDIVVWPENSADIDPLGNPDANALITSAARAIRAPILVGAVLGRKSHNPELNAILLWTSDGYQGIRHVKRHIQPFGEYLPLRGLVEKISPYAVWAGNFQAGRGNGIIPVDGSRAGVATCFEIIFGDSGRRAIHHGADWLAVPTNNATFGYSHETYQQLGISQFRARELHRWVVVAATSGASAFISPEGAIMDETSLYEQDFAVRTVSLYQTRTAATCIQPWLDGVLCVLAVLVCGGSIIARRKRKITL